MKSLENIKLICYGQKYKFSKYKKCGVVVMKFFLDPMRSVEKSIKYVTESILYYVSIGSLKSQYVIFSTNNR